MQTLWRDIRYGLRGLWRNPAFTIVAVISLGLAIGANTAIFSLVDAVMIRPLPFREADRLMMVWEDQSSLGYPQNTPAPANFADWKRQNQVFEDMAALYWQSFNLLGDGEPEKISAYAVTGNFLPLLGVQPLLGRNFSTDEDQPGGSKVAILSYGLWQRRFGGDRGVINREIVLTDTKYTVVGVMPKDFQFLQSYIGLWVPAAFSQEHLALRKENTLTVVARLKPGVTRAQAQADIGAITERIAHDYPDDARGLKSGVVPLHEELTGKVRQPLIMLLVAVGLVLLIGCANLANLLLSRAARRSKEIAVRTALGASRARIVRQLLTESVLLSAIGGACGLLVAPWTFIFIRSLIPDVMIRYTAPRVDLRLLLYALVVSVITGIVFGLAPALRTSRIDLHESLKQGGRVGLSGKGERLRGAFVISEVALALVLLVAAGLLMQTVFHLRNQYSLFQPGQILTFRTVLPAKRYAERAQRIAFYDQVLERVSGLPGVVSAGYTTSVPLQWKGGTSDFTMETEPPAGVTANAIHRQVSSTYLETMGVRLREGRYFNEHDNQQSQPVAIINETMARQFWPGGSALNRRIKFGPPDGPHPWFAIVGVIADVRQMGIDSPVKAEMYFSYRQINTHRHFAPRDLVIRVDGDPLSLVAAVRREVYAVDPDQPLSSIATMEEQLSSETGPRAVGMRLLIGFAGLALLLAALGIYGVLAYFVTQHTAEIGVRLALGAQPRNVLALVLKKGMGLALAGVALGCLLAFMVTRLMSNLLFGIAPTDATTFLAVSVGLCAVALLACYIPARRATKVDPLVALRYE